MKKHYCDGTFLSPDEVYAPGAEDFLNLSGITWTGTEEEKNEIDTKLQVVADRSKANGRPIYLGEFGAYKKVTWHPVPVIQDMLPGLSKSLASAGNTGSSTAILLFMT